jgi:hypothetical protein
VFACMYALHCLNTYMLTCMHTYTYLHRASISCNGSMHKYMHTYIHAHTHAHLHAYIHEYIHAYIHSQTPISANRPPVAITARIYVHTHTHSHMHNTYIQTKTFEHRAAVVSHGRSNIHIRTFVHTYMHAYIHAGKHQSASSRSRQPWSK